VAAVPSPYGLGYDLSRLRRSGLRAVVFESSRGNARLVLGFDVAADGSTALTTTAAIHKAYL
jgi:hypothetical protein